MVRIKNASQGRRFIIEVRTSSVGVRVNRYLETCAILALELHRTIDERVDGVVLAKADVVTRVDGCTTLTQNDAARENCLTAEALHTESFCIGVATVLGRTAAFFVCHFDTP